MKTRQGFVSNSSSSSFILYGRTLETEELVEVMFTMNEEAVLSRFDVDITEHNNKRQEALDEAIANAHHAYDLGEDFENMMPDEYKAIIHVDWYCSEEGCYRIGLLADPESLSRDQVINGIFKKEHMVSVEAFFKENKIGTPGVAGGTWYG